MRTTSSALAQPAVARAALQLLAFSGAAVWCWSFGLVIGGLPMAALAALNGGVMAALRAA
jgi:hypothetical protein